MTIDLMFGTSQKCSTMYVGKQKDTNILKRGCTSKHIGGDIRHWYFLEGTRNINCEGVGEEKDRRQLEIRREVEILKQ